MANTKNNGARTGEKKMDFNDLIEKGKKGNLTGDELDLAIEELDLDMDQLDKLYETLENHDIALGGDMPGSADMAEIENEIVAFRDSESMEHILEQEGLTIDDPVRLYLKEIGKVPLLTNEREKSLAERMMAGDETAKTELVEKDCIVCDCAMDEIFLKENAIITRMGA